MQSWNKCEVFGVKQPAYRLKCNHNFRYVMPNLWEGLKHLARMHTKLPDNTFFRSSVVLHLAFSPVLLIQPKYRFRHPEILSFFTSQKKILDQSIHKMFNSLLKTGAFITTFMKNVLVRMLSGRAW